MTNTATESLATPTVRLHRSGIKRSIGREVAAKAGDLLPLCDFAVLLLTSLVSAAAYGALSTGTGSDHDLGRLAWIAAATAAFVLYDAQFSLSAATSNVAALASKFAQRWVTLLLVLCAIAFAGRWLDNAPLKLLLFWTATAVLLTGSSRVLLVHALRRLARQGIWAQSVAVVGSGSAADRLIPLLRGNAALFGVFDDRSSTRTVSCIHRPEATLEGLIARIVKADHSERPDRILISLPGVAKIRLRTLVDRLRPLKIPVEHCAPNGNFCELQQAVAYIGDCLPVTLLADRPIKRWDAVFKTIEDFVLSSILAVVLLPVMACIALAIKLDSPGPVLYKQRRHGYNNKEFDIYKFRSMHCSTGIPGEVLRQTTRDDIRITRVGRFLRKFSLDELPQVFNVLEGDMSLVGPRPHAVNMRTEEQLGHEITRFYLHRHRVKPGITGWAQVNGSRGATDTVEKLRRRVELDLHYAEHWSLLLDLKILCLTIVVVLRGTNAY